MVSSYELHQTATLAVSCLTGNNARLISEGKSSYWAFTSVVESGDKHFFVKQTTNPVKAESSRCEPVVTELVRSFGISCPLAYIFYEANALHEGSLPCIVYEYQQSGTGKVFDGDDLTNNHSFIQNETVRNIGKTLASINDIPPEGTNKFKRGLSKNHLHNYEHKVEGSSILSDKRKKQVIALIKKFPATLNKIGLHHTDFYPANLLFDSLENPQLISITDWEKAEFAPLGTDFLGLCAICSQFCTTPESPIEEYRACLELTPQQIKYQLLTFGLVQAIALQERVQSILAKDQNAISDPKIAKFQKWLNDYTDFAFRYE